MSVWNWNRLGAVAWVAACGSGLILSAQEPQGVGIVRISDGGRRVQPVGHATKGEYHAAPYSSGALGDCPECHGYGKHSGCKSCKLCEHYCTKSADSGFSLPAKYPVHRRGVQYTQYFPTTWYGTPGVGGAPAAAMYPMVYTPTDTTQLGFYGQHVPFWQPQPNPLPERPIPAQWHQYPPPAPASRFHAGPWGWGYGYGNCPVMIDGATPTPAQTPNQLQPVPEAEAPEPPPAPAPLKESAIPSPLQRASF